MAGQRRDVKTLLLGSALLLSLPLLAANAQANPAGSPNTRGNDLDPAVPHPGGHHGIAATYHPGSHERLPFTSHAVALGHGRPAHPAVRQASRGGISCVPYAREVSGIEVGGNAWQWWGHAAGRYARGNHPEPGSVLAFRANPRMPLGHVAVVSTVINSREIIIDHANWPSPAARGNVSLNISAIDVSEANDWSAVRVELGRGDKFGAVYPTYGFIYHRPDDGIIEASVHAPAPQPDLNPAPRDLRPVAERPWRSYEEVAEAPDAPPHRINLSGGGMH